MQMDEHLYKIIDKVKNFTVIYVCDNKGPYPPLSTSFTPPTHSERCEDK
jgi:hypothetical protein